MWVEEGAGGSDSTRVIWWLKVWHFQACRLSSLLCLHLNKPPYWVWMYNPLEAFTPSPSYTQSQLMSLPVGPSGGSSTPCDLAAMSWCLQTFCDNTCGSVMGKGNWNRNGHTRDRYNCAVCNSELLTSSVNYECDVWFFPSMLGVNNVTSTRTVFNTPSSVFVVMSSGEYFPHCTFVACAFLPVLCSLTPRTSHVAPAPTLSLHIIVIPLEVSTNCLVAV